MRILVVEDEAAFRGVLERALRRWGHEPVACERLREAADLVHREADLGLVLLDRQVADGDGLTLCRRLKRDPRTRGLPVLMLTGLTGFDDELAGYEGGADLYLSKPVDLEKLRKYLEALLRRRAARDENPGQLRCGTLVLDLEAGVVRAGTRTAGPVPPKLFDLLVHLAARQGRTVSRESLLRKVWKSPVRDKQVDIAVLRLRKALGPELGPCVEAVRGKGYRIAPAFAAPDEDAHPSPSLDRPRRSRK